ncbi:MAG: hypothetical protein WA004_08525 [Saprospiraceae bacterium]
MNKILLVFAFLAVILDAFSQESLNYSIKQLELVSSPAYALLGVQPTNIQRPSTPRDFVMGLQHMSEDGVVQPGFAMETNPFNWKRGGDKSKKEYFFSAEDYFFGNGWTALKRNFALSFVSASTDTTNLGNLGKGVGLGIGFRATLIPGTVHKPTYNAFFTWAFSEAKLIIFDHLESDGEEDIDENGLSALLDEAFKDAKQWVFNTEQIPEVMKPVIRNKLGNYRVELENELRAGLNDKKKVQDLLKSKVDIITSDKDTAIMRINSRPIPFARDGFILEFAYSSALHLKDGFWDEISHARAGLWLMPSYRFDMSSDENLKLVQSVDVLGILRVIWNDERVDFPWYWDIGAKLQYNRNNWNVAFEGIARYASNEMAEDRTNWTYSWIGNFAYLINDYIALRFSFGSNFNGTTGSFSNPNPVLIMGGFNIGIPN